MDKIETEFRNYGDLVKHLKTKPTNNELLQLYGYYKQALYGNNRTTKPTMFNMTEVSKWNAWNNLSGTGKYSSMQLYASLAKSLILKYGLDQGYNTSS